MTIKHMRIFIAVYQQMNITHAAEILHMTQPAVSRAIQELENHFDIRLFERMKNRLYRNQAADAFYAKAIHIVDSFRDVEAEFNNWDTFETLRIGASITLGNYFLPLVMNMFQQRFPKTRTMVKISNTGSIERLLLNNQIDVALVEGKTTSEYLHEDQFGENRMVLILPPNHPLLKSGKIGLRNVAGYPLLLREAGSAGRTFIDNVFDTHEIKVTPAWESASTQAIVRAVSYGFGIAILPEQLAIQDIKAGRVATRPIADVNLVRGNYIVHHCQKYLTDSANHFIELCRENKAQEVGCLQAKLP